MSLLFFLKHHHRPIGVTYVSPEPVKRKRKRVYEVTKKEKEIIARPVDWAGFAESLFRSRRKAQEARDESDLILLRWLLEDT